MRLGHDESRGLYGTSATADEQRVALQEGAVPVAVYGLGKMGLPLATVLAGVTGNVVGVDIDESVVRRVNAGDCPVENEPRLPDLLSTAVTAGALSATSEATTAADAASLHVVVVPTTLRDDDVPDLSNLRTAVRDVAAGLDPGDVVLVESTVPPGTCREVVHPLLVEQGSVPPGEFGVAFCPERTASGRALRDIRGAHPKIVGGVDDESTRVAELVYGEVTSNDVIPVADAATAEAVKVFEGVYRDVNIALANELARFTDEMGVDVNAAIEAANTQPYCDIHDPGIGVGGHCIPYYPHFLLGEFATEAPLMRTAREVNDGMPLFAASVLEELLAQRGVHVEDATVVVLGVAYRAGVPETRESPARPLVDRLGDLGATVAVVDPVVDDLASFDAYPLAVDQLPETDFDAAVLVTAHEAFEELDWAAIPDSVVVDGRDALDLAGTGHAVYTIGSG